MENQLKTIAFLLLVFGAPLWVPAQDKPMHIYVLMGQSNMAGRGAVTTTYVKQGHESVFMLNPQNEWVPAKHPLHFDKPKIAGVGPGLTFGIAMAEAYPEATIGLVPCAVGGTPIRKWVPGAYDGNTDTHPYDDALVRIKEAMKHGTIKGVIWHQGEGDSNTEASQVYIDRLAELIGRIRNEVNDPTLPIVVGQLARYRDHYQNINRELPKLPERVDRTIVVSSEGLWHKGDGTHFDSSSSAEYGRRFARGMLTLQYGNTLSNAEKKAGWELLFDGEDPNMRWRSKNGDAFPTEGWRVENGKLVLKPGRKGKDIITREQFSDFELVLDFKLTDSANTGIKYFVSQQQTKNEKQVLNGPEYQLIDDFKHAAVADGKNPKTSTASVYLLYAPARKKLRKTGRWNRARIVAKEMHVEHWLNGTKVLEYDRGSAAFRQRVARTKFSDYKTEYGEAKAGHILLQDHGDQAFFRRIKIRRLK